MKHPREQEKEQAPPQILVFDYGNTLVPFGPEELHRVDSALAEGLEDRLGPIDLEQLRAVRNRERAAPFEGSPPSLVENDFRELTSQLLRDFGLSEPSERDVEETLALRSRAFLDAIGEAPHLPELLADLGERFRLALLSNYPSGDDIRESLARVGIDLHFEVVVVSGDVGFVKPHAAPFEAVLERLDAPAQDCLFVGDNWLADIQGAKRAGMRAAYLTEHAPLGEHEPRAGDSEPDYRISRLEELLQL